MRHLKAHRRFGRTTSHRKSMFRNMATSLFQHETFYTTVEKAKDLRVVAEKLITLGKNDTLAARRRAYSYLMDKDIVHKLFADIGPRFKSRNGGYLRIVKADFRHGDAAKMAYIQMVDESKGVVASPEKKKAPAKAKAAAKPAKAAVKKEAKAK